MTTQAAHPSAAPLATLTALLQEIMDLRSAGALLYWDQATYLPPGGTGPRARQVALLSKLAHEAFTAPTVGKCLAKLAKTPPPAGSPEAALVRIVQRDFQRATCVPASLVAALAAHGSSTYEAWTKARPANDFSAVQPGLERSVELARQLADCFPGYEHPIDPLIANIDYGMTAARLRTVFAALRAELVPLATRICDQPPADDSCLRGHYDEAAQLAFGEVVAKRFGYDYTRGRQDRTHHPFMITIAPGDVRITTRVRADYLGEALFSTLHEAGHALYEQGIAERWAGTPVFEGSSAGVHESQSRLWENVVGRSRGFWQWAYPHLQQAFPQQLGHTHLDTFYRAINKVRRSLIRTESDEVTYNLHVLIRFDLECALLAGTLAVKDLPEAWNARYQSDLGLTPPTLAQGVLQDVHWFHGTLGGCFQCYTLGNLMAAQFYDAALRADPQIRHDIANGSFTRLLGWLRTQVHHDGRARDPEVVLQEATGAPLGHTAYLAYLRSKYGELYTL